MAEAAKLTMPQIIMLNHAAWVNKENADRRYEAKKKTTPDDPVIQAEEDKLSQMSPAELSMYLASPFE